MVTPVPTRVEFVAGFASRISPPSSPELFDEIKFPLAVTFPVKVGLEEFTNATTVPPSVFV
jgi:hypothetical protein